jgi:DNA-binding GntR family transcriptional regulator
MATALRAPARSLDHGRRRQAIVESILADVFARRLRAGQHLVTQDLARRFGVSHTPIREALIALAGMGFIDLVPNRGAVVRRVTPREVREVCQVRRLLECQATRSACSRIDRRELAELERELRRVRRLGPRGGPGLVAEARAADTRLHDLIAASCGNAFLSQELRRQQTLFRAFRDVSYTQAAARNDYGRLVREAEEHLEIVLALLAGQARQAAAAMSRHIRSGMSYWTRELGVAQRAADPSLLRTSKWRSS